MRKGFLTLIFALSVASGLQAQCDGCKQVTAEVIDYCYQEADFSNRCVQFTEDAATFYYLDYNRAQGNVMKLALPAELAKPDNTYLNSLDPDKKLNLSAVDLSLMEHAIARWREMEALRKWDRAIMDDGMQQRPSGLAYKPIIVGKGKLPVRGKKVNVHYTGYLESGEKFESSLDRRQTLQFALGLGQVIKGWDEGLSIMTVGSRYLLRIPPALGYGAAGAGEGDIPPNATLYFDIQLISAE